MDMQLIHKLLYLPFGTLQSKIRLGFRYIAVCITAETGDLKDELREIKNNADPYNSIHSLA